MSSSTAQLVVALAGFSIAAIGGAFVFGGAAADATITTDARAAAALTSASAAQHTDLLSGPIAPGADGATGVTLPLGSHASEIQLTGESLGAFAVTSTLESPTDDGAGTWLVVSVHNASDRELRFTADVAFGSGSGSGAP